MSSWEKSMKLEDVSVGSSVQVQLDYRKPHRRGAVGTVKKRYGTGEYTAFEVLFSNGKRELFWGHQLEELEEAEESFPWTATTHAVLGV
jgi:hypothetical protein